MLSPCQAALRIDRDFKVSANENAGQVSIIDPQLDHAPTISDRKLRMIDCANCAVTGERNSRATAVFAVSKSFRFSEQLVRETTSRQKVTNKISFTCLPSIAWG
jgi:hypothetical protein